MIILSKDPKKMRGSAREELGKRTPGRRYSRCEIPKVVVGLACVEEQEEGVENEVTVGMRVILCRDPLVIVSFKH